VAYGGAWDDRTILSTELPTGRYDFIASQPSGNAEALQKEVEKQFRVVAKREMIETNVLVLTVKIPDAQGLKPTKTQHSSSEGSGSDRFSCVNQSISFLAGYLEGEFGTPVIDQTGLTQNFDINLKWNRNDPQHDSLKQALLDKLGLELVPTNMPVEMLVVEKAIN